MRILFQALDVDLGVDRGDSIHTRNLAMGLARCGHSVHLVSGAATGGVVLPGVDLTVRPQGGDLAIISHVRRVSLEFRPEVIYERRFSPKIAAALSLLIRKPYVIEYNGIVDEEAAMQGRPLRNTAASRIRGAIRVRLLRRAAAVVTVTPGLRDIVARDYGVPASRISIVENGVDPTMFQPSDRIEARSVLDLQKGPLVCFVGNLVRWQGLDGLLVAMSEIPGDVRCVIVGDGVEKTHLVHQANALGIHDRVKFVGNVPHSLVPTYVAAADVCVAPFSYQRNARSGVSALKLYEYLACGRPVAVTAIPGARELVEASGCGIVVPPDNPTALGKAIVRIIEDPSFAEAAFRESAQVRKDRSWDRVASEVARVLEIAA
jgi:glycosyltransferase involved in cell wall biosynthesis